MRTWILTIAYSLATTVVGQQEGNPDEAAVRFAKSYIVEFAAGTIGKRSSLASTDGVKVIKDFDSDVFNGASVETADLNLDGLLSLPDVVGVWPSGPVYLEPSAPVDASLQAASSVVHSVTGVGKLHEQGIFGRGVKSGVVDTGIWYNHDALGGGFGEGFKVVGGCDFVGDQYWPSIGYEREPDSGPLDLLGHGTHVAGIIVGKADDFTGVAPEATLYAYKVMSRQGSTDAATLIESFLKAYDDGSRPDSSSKESWTVVTISAANSGSQGAFYSSSGSSGKKVLAVASADAPSVDAVRASSFTSWGLLNDLSVKPDVTAPGGSIYSTYLDNGWTTMSGTVGMPIGLSMGKWRRRPGWANQITRIHLRQSGYHDSWYAGLFAPVPQVGNGLVDAVKLLHSNTTLDFRPIALNDTRYFSRYHDITVKNGGSEDVTYHLSAQDAYGVEALLLNSNTQDKQVKTLSQLVPQKLAVEVSLPRDFTLKPGESKTVSVNFKNPDTLGWNAALLPLYSGRIIVSGDIGEELSVPYAGLAGDLRKELTPLFRNGFPYVESGAPAVRGKTSFTFNLTLEVQDFPKIFHNILWGTRELRWDIFGPGWSERQWAYPPVVGENGYVGSGAYWVGSGQAPFFDPSRWDLEDTLSYPKINQPRSNFNFENWWFGKLANGSQIAVGNYTLRYAALKPFGSPAHSDNWATFTTPIEVLG
ncbi:Thermostable alkaline protease, partial [Colletotrichum shisoi]